MNKKNLILYKKTSSPKKISKHLNYNIESNLVNSSAGLPRSGAVYDVTIQSIYLTRSLTRHNMEKSMHF